MTPNTPPAPSRRLNPTLWLVVGLPLVAVAASLLTLVIALNHPWTPDGPQLDRFGQPIASPAESR